MDTITRGPVQAGALHLARKSQHYDLNDLPTTQPEIEDMLARVEGEIAEISEQMLTEDGDDGWAARARAARRFRFSLKAKLERRLKEMAPKRQSVAAMKLEATRLNAEAAKRKADQKAASIEATNIVERRKLRALVTWLRAEHPALVEAAFKAMDEVEGE